MTMESKEKLAACVHESWSRWMAYLFEKSTKNSDGTVTIPAWAVERWERQFRTQYADLPETEKDTDRDEATKILQALGKPTVDPETCPHTNLDTFIEPHGDGWSRCKDCGTLLD